MLVIGLDGTLIFSQPQFALFLAYCVCQRLLEHSLMPRVLRRLEERLRTANRDNLELAYEGLKAYLMVYTPDKFDAEAFKAWVTVDWDATLERSMTAEPSARPRPVPTTSGAVAEMVPSLPRRMVQARFCTVPLS